MPAAERRPGTTRYVVREGRPEDAPAMAEVHVRGWQTGCAGLIDADHLAGLSITQATRRWAGHLANPAPATTVRVATEDTGTENVGTENVATEATGTENTGTENVGTEYVGTENADTRVTDTVVGFVRVGRSIDPASTFGNAPTPGELFELYVGQPHWGTGVAAALHDAGLALLAADGFVTASLWVVRGNARAIAFYRRRGWVPDGLVRTQHEDGAGWEELRFRRALDLQGHGGPMPGASRVAP
ncbi:GNAT family N-acetyltransferase [Microlunatus sp. Y2014]|uniref:GNAT family N-acetyltransferase n=1 Tax=Microlunatus sp. Y2014 TaxID=3418488 RepID=UPI003DA6F686